MQISENGVALIKRYEGCRLTAYKPVAGEKYYTIGWGHYGADVTKDMKITQAQADTMLLCDLVKYERYVNNKNFVPQINQLNQNQFDALVSFCYNCGCGNLQKLCKGKTIQKIANDILKYNHGAGGVVLKGLTRRRKEEQKLFLTPVNNRVLKKNVEEIAREVIAGKWSNGNARKTLLEKAGYNYREVQNMVNKLLK